MFWQLHGCRLQGGCGHTGEEINDRGRAECLSLSGSVELDHFSEGGKGSLQKLHMSPD